MRNNLNIKTSDLDFGWDDMGNYLLNSLACVRDLEPMNDMDAIDLEDSYSKDAVKKMDQINENYKNRLPCKPKKFLTKKKKHIDELHAKHVKNEEMGR